MSDDPMDGVYQPVLDRIEERVHNRREQWHTEETPVLPPPQWLDETCIVSRYSRIGLSTRRRYLLERILVSVNGTKDTPSAVARDYITIKYKRGPKWTSAQRDKIREELVDHPMYVKPCTFDEGYYVDIRATYWSVMVRCGWRVQYFPGRFLCKQTPPLDFPFAESKRARNCLVSVARSNQMQMWSPDKGDYKASRGNPRANSQLYCLITDSLHGIACEAVAAGAVYVFADGYIAPDYNTMLKVCEAVKSWGFIAAIKGEGRGYVNNLGSYVVGRLFTKSLSDTAVPYDNLKHLSYHKWLRERMLWTRLRAPWHDKFITSPRRIGNVKRT